MVFDHRTIAIESMVLQSTIGDDGFSMVNEKKRRWFSKIAIYDKKLLLEFNFWVKWGPFPAEMGTQKGGEVELGIGEETNLIYFYSYDDWFV